MSKKDISELIRRYEQAIESGKNIYLDADEFSDLAEYYDMQEDTDVAREIIESGLAIHPGSTSLLAKKVKFVIYDGDYVEALGMLDKIGEYNFDLYLLKIECLLQLERYDEAYNLTEELLEKEDEEDQDHIFAELGFLHVEADCFKEAAIYFQESLKFNPENIEVLSDLAYAYEMLADFDAAIDTTNKILDIEPYTYEAWINLGKLFSLKEEFEKAIDAFDFALTINDSDSNVLKLKAHCLSIAGRVEEAVEIFKELLLLDPNDNSLYLLLSECYQSLEMYSEALDSLDEYVSIIGETEDLIVKRIWLFLQKEDYKAATLILKGGLILYPESVDLEIAAGEIAFKLGDYVEAKSIYLSAYSKSQEDFHLIDRLAVISIKEEDYSQAAYYTENLLELDPDNLEVKERLALLYFEIDDKEQFNDVLDQFTDKELLSLFKLIYTPENSNYFDRDMLIAYLNRARETRTLFKNLKY